MISLIAFNISIGKVALQLPIQLYSKTDIQVFLSLLIVELGLTEATSMHSITRWGEGGVGVLCEAITLFASYDTIPQRGNASPNSLPLKTLKDKITVELFNSISLCFQTQLAIRILFQMQNSTELYYTRSWQ